MAKNNIILTLHGIRWRGLSDWQNTLGVYIKEKSPETKVFHCRYGRVLGIVSWWMSVTNFLNIHSWIKSHYIKKVIKFVKKIKKKFPDHEMSIITYSFGGWLLEQAMIKDESIIFKNIIFMHCPISSHIETTSFWNWLEFKRIEKVFSWSSHKDFVIGKIAIKPLGQNGYWGFIRYGNSEDREKPLSQPYPINLWNVQTEEDHGGVLDNLEKYGDKILEQLGVNA